MVVRSIHVERAFVGARLVGAWAVLLGLIVMAWSLVSLPWHEAKRTSADWESIDVAAQDANMKSAPGADVKWINTHESRTSMSEMAASGIAYIVPGMILLLLARYVSRPDFWAYVGVCLVGLGFVAIYVVDLMLWLGMDLPIHEEPILFETLLRPAGLYLLVVCLNALPDARDESRNRRRRQRGFEPIMSTPPATILPRPISVARDPARRGN